MWFRLLVSVFAATFAASIAVYVAHNATGLLLGNLVGLSVGVVLVQPLINRQTARLNDLEQKQVLQEQIINDLTRAKNWAEALLQSITEGIISYDEGGKIAYFNEGAAQIVGFPAAQASDQPLNAILKLANDTQKEFSESVPASGGRRVVTIHTQKNRDASLAVTRARPVQPGLSTIVLHDVTEEMNLRNLQAYFLAHISHEFRTPLSGLKVSIELLLENVHRLSAREIDALLSSIHLSASSLQNLVDNLLESTKIEANQMALHRRPTALKGVIAEAIRIMQPLLNRRQQLLAFTEPFTYADILIDSPKIVQVVVNLLSNASKYSPMAATIEISIEKRDQHLRLSVADCGPGIAAEDRENVFRRFVRLQSQNGDEYGVGLGLSVVKAMVEAHGGVVGVDARAEGGSIFWITLPADEMES